MNKLFKSLFSDAKQDDARSKTALTMVIVLSLPLLIVFPKLSGWLSGILTIAGFICLIRFRNFSSMDWEFVAICCILPLADLGNMLLMGWAPGYLERPTHLLWALMIYFLIGRYGVHRNALFYSAFFAAVGACMISIFEGLYLGHERIFGLNNQWNAVPFGNFSLLFGFFCLCGAFVSHNTERRRLRLWLGGIGFVCGLFASILAGTRGGWVAVPFLIVLSVFLNNRLTMRARGLALMIAVVALTTVFISSDRIRTRTSTAVDHVSAYLADPQDLNAESTATGMRLSMWHWGLEKFKEHPLTGIGIAAYKDERKAAVEAGVMSVEFDGLANLHNSIITALALGGIPAAMTLIAYWILGWHFFYSRLKSNDDDQHYFALCGLVVVLGTALFSMTESLFGTSAGTKAIMLALAIPAGMLRHLYLTPPLRLQPDSRSGQSKS